MNLGARSKTGADLCSYNEVEKIQFTRISLKDSPEYIWMKKYFSKPLEVEGETQEYIQGGKVIINLLCMRYGEEFVIIIRRIGKKRKKKKLREVSGWGQERDQQEIKGNPSPQSCPQPPILK